MNRLKIIVAASFCLAFAASSWAITVTAQYDDYGRLTGVSYGESNGIGYEYDLNGNLRETTVEGEGEPCNQFDLSADCEIDANDLLKVIAQSTGFADLFEFSSFWQMDLDN